MEQSEAGTNAHNLLQNSVIYPFGLGFSKLYRNPSLTVFLVWLYIKFGGIK